MRTFEVRCGVARCIAMLAFACGVLVPEHRAQAQVADVRDDTLTRHEAARAAEIEALVERLYAPVGGAAVWITPELRATRQAWDALEVVRAAASEGLDPRDYDVERIEHDLRTADGEAGVSAEQAGRIDLALTRAVTAYADDLAHGRIDPGALDLAPDTPPLRIDIPATLGIALAEQRIRETLAALAPVHPEYRLLRDARVGYQAVVAAGGWVNVPEGETMKPGESHRVERLIALATRLAAEGLLERTWTPAPVPTSTVPASTTSPATDTGTTMPQLGPRATAPAAHGLGLYDDTLAQAVRAFQSRRGIEVDGVVGPRTLSELNRSADEVVRAIELNMERWRWLPDRLGTDELRTNHLRVNVPAFELRAFEAGRRVLSMPIIVGQATWGTPLFSDRVESVVVRPYWNVPYSIATKELLPKAFADPSYLTREGIEIARSFGPNAEAIPPDVIDWSEWTPATFPYRLRQRPGPLNPLGRIKFMLPNRHNIYLHDTPAGALFQRNVRALSHGCIRVAEPLDLAAWLFRGDPEWTRERLSQAMAGGETRTIRLPESVPVHLLYFTAEIGEDGRLTLYRDVYGMDEQMNRALELMRTAPPL